MTDATPKVVVSTVCDDDFEPGFVVLVATLLAHNPWFDHEIRVISTPDAYPLSTATRERMLARYPNTTFHDVDLSTYEPLIAQGDHRARFLPAFAKLEAFGFTDADRVIALDLDMMVMGDVSELVACTDAFNSVEAEHVDGGKRGFPHGAVFVINRDNLTGERYDAMLHTTFSPDNPCPRAADQAVLWEHFGRAREHISLDPRFNVVRGLFPAETGDLVANLQAVDARIFHVGGKKPWFGGASARRWAQSEALWLETYLTLVDRADLARMLEIRRRRQGVPHPLRQNSNSTPSTARHSR